MCRSARDDGLPVSAPPVPAGGRLWVAFSGGLDSTVLLHWLKQSASRPLHAVHVHHGLQALADDWAAHCREVCRQWDIPLEVIEVEVRDIEALGLEAAARNARYAALAELLEKDDVLVTAHHRRDQAETLLLQLLRGSGPHGLAAMPASAPLGQGILQRPLLETGHDDLLAYARAHKLQWIEDPSNEDVSLRRNYLRHEVLPLLARHWPEHEASLSRSAALQAEAATLLEDLAGLDIRHCHGGLPQSLSVRALLALSATRRRNVIRHWLRRQGLAMPHQAHLHRIEQDVLHARDDAEPCVTWSDVQLRRYRDDLLAMSALPAAPGGQVLEWDLSQPLVLPRGCGELRAERAQGAGLRLESPQVEVRFDPAGERIQPVFSKYHKRLKHLFQEAAVPPWVRERVPLIYHGQRLAAVADRWTAAEFAARHQEKGWRLHWIDAPRGWPVDDGSVYSGDR